MKLTTMTQITVDGVMQGNGHATPDELEAGFTRDGCRVGSEIAVTSLPASRPPAASAMSAWATMPQIIPLSSTTGTRRTRFSSITRRHSSSVASAATHTTGVVMHSPADICPVSRPAATALQSAARIVKQARHQPGSVEVNRVASHVHAGLEITRQDFE